MDKEIIEGNRIIAEKFMVKRLEDAKYSLVLTDAKSFIKQPQWFSVEQLEYHSSWDWQVPVMAKVFERLTKVMIHQADRYRDHINILSNEWQKCAINNEVLRGFRFLVHLLNTLNEANSNQPQGGK